jgi:hypothetical protein
MKRIMQNAMAFVAALGLLGLAMPAAAELDLTVNVDKDKDVYVVVDLYVDKFIDIDVILNEVLDGAAEAHALANIENTWNEVGPCDASCPGGGPAMGPDPDDLFYTFNLDLEATLVDSVQANQGIVGLNQDVGNMVNQGNMLAFARTEFTDGESLIVSDAEAEIDQLNTYNDAWQEEMLPEPDVPDPDFDIFDDPDHASTIRNSINRNNGVVGVNQNSGNMNNQTNAVAMVIGEGNAVVLTEAALGQENAFNEVLGIETVKIDLITNSINANNGVVSVNQSVGNMNNQGSSIAFGALTSTATIGVPGS